MIVSIASGRPRKLATNSSAQSVRWMAIHLILQDGHPAALGARPPAEASAPPIGGRGLVREGVDELLGRPGGGGMRGDVEVDDAPAVVGKHNENEQDTEANGGRGEEVDAGRSRRCDWRGTSARLERGGGGVSA